MHRDAPFNGRAVFGITMAIWALIVGAYLHAEGLPFFIPWAAVVFIASGTIAYLALRGEGRRSA